MSGLVEILVLRIQGYIHEVWLNIMNTTDACFRSWKFCRKL